MFKIIKKKMVKKQLYLMFNGSYIDNTIIITRSLCAASEDFEIEGLPIPQGYDFAMVTVNITKDDFIEFAMELHKYGYCIDPWSDDATVYCLKKIES